jgi:hypothetical protein
MADSKCRLQKRQAHSRNGSQTTDRSGGAGIGAAPLNRAHTNDFVPFEDTHGPVMPVEYEPYDVLLRHFGQLSRKDVLPKQPTTNAANARPSGNLSIAARIAWRRTASIHSLGLITLSMMRSIMFCGSPLLYTCTCTNTAHHSSSSSAVVLSVRCPTRMADGTHRHITYHSK